MSAIDRLSPPPPSPSLFWTSTPFDKKLSYYRRLAQRQLPPDEPPELLHRAIGQPTAGSGQVTFTRQLWRRTMPGNVDKNEISRVLDESPSAFNAIKSTSQGVPASDRAITLGPSRSGRSQPHSPDRSESGSKTPLTPDKSLSFTTTRTRKWSTVFVTDPDKDDDQPLRVLDDHPDLPSHPCICKSDPKIPRPRNAFILYRQAKQAQVVADHPGLANPKISKIIGELWQKETANVKNEWKRLAEDEKVRHQQQYPSYRYQPKRNTSRNSHSSDGSEPVLEATKCDKCGGGTAFRSSTPYTVGQFHSSASDPALLPVTPASAGLPGFGHLSVHSPRSQHMGRPSAGQNSMSYPQQHQPSPHDRRGEPGPLSPDSKRRRFNSEQPGSVVRSLPPRFAGAVGPVPVTQGPATPFPYHPQAGHWGPAMHGRRDSLPAMQRISPPGAMQPPPQPVIGYQQHRLSQGHVPQDRSLVLPPLKTGPASVAPGSVPAAANGKDPNAAAPARTPGLKPLEFRTKIKVLSQVAHPAPKGPRGPLIAIEGDDSYTVRELGAWLRETLDRTHEDLTVRQLFEPKIDVGEGSKEEVMMRYHGLVGEWLLKSQTIVEGLAVRPAPAGSTSTDHSDVQMGDASATTSQPPAATPVSSRKLDESYNDDSESESTSVPDGIHVGRRGRSTTVTRRSSVAKGEKAEPNRGSAKANNELDEEMDMEPASASSPLASTIMSPSKAATTASAGKTPVTIITNFSLHASNAVARRIPIGGLDPYAPNDHWQWTATQWRGIVGPDLTIYVLDEREPAAVGAGVTMETVETRPEVGLFVVARSPRADGGGLELEAVVLRRLGFEVAEWVRAFMSGKKASPGSSGKA